MAAVFGLVWVLFDVTSELLPTWSCWLQFVPVLVLGLVRGHVVKYTLPVMPPVSFSEQKP